MSDPATVRVKCQPCQGNPEGIVTINQSDYDPAKHDLYVPDKSGKAEKSEKDEKGPDKSGKAEK